MDERDKKRRRMNTEGESDNRDHDKQKIDDGQIVASDHSADIKEELNSSDIADSSSADFKVVKTKLTFVDKSECIKGFFQCPASGVQITAPRRFGKSTFMDMLRIFLNIIVDEDAKPIPNPEDSDDYKMFMNLKLGKHYPDFVKKHCGQYPVIFMSLKDVGGKEETAVLDSLKNAICNAFEVHRYLLETAPDGSESFKNKKIRCIGKFLKSCDTDRLKELSEADVVGALKFLSRILYTHFNKKVVLLIDEADAPIMKAIVDNVPDETIKYTISLLREMLSAGLKGNEFFERSLVSSVCLSGVYSRKVNNQYHASFLQDDYFCETYGFTEEEVKSLLQNAAFKEVSDFNGVKKWYNGYQELSKDEATIYNSWSVIRYLIESIEEQKKMFYDYWAKSNWVNILGKLFVNHKIREAVDELVAGKSIKIKVAEPTIENILQLKRTISNPQNQFNQSQLDFFLQLLWDDGLLSAVKMFHTDNVVELRIPNFQNKKVIQRNCYTQSLFEVNYKLKPMNIEKYLKALKKLLEITSNEEESDEEESEIKENEEDTTKIFEEAMYNLVNAVSLLFSEDATIPVTEAELHHILFYLAYNNNHFILGSHRPVVKVTEELRDDAKLKKVPRRKDQSKTKEKRGRKSECDMCVVFETAAVIFEIEWLKNEQAENSKAALQQIIRNKYFTLLDKEEYKHVKTKIYVGLCVGKNLNVTAHYLVNDTNLDNAKTVDSCVNK